MKKEAHVIEKAILANIPDSEKSGLELGLALAASHLGNLTVEKADRPKKLA